MNRAPENLFLHVFADEGFGVSSEEALPPLLVHRGGLSRCAVVGERADEHVTKLGLERRCVGTAYIQNHVARLFVAAGESQQHLRSGRIVIGRHDAHDRDPEIDRGGDTLTQAQQLRDLEATALDSYRVL